MSTMRGLWFGVALGLLLWGLIFLLGFGIKEAAAHHCKRGTHCRELKQGYEPCKNLRPRYPRQAKCNIRRAAAHYHQSFYAMRAVAYCESRYQWWIRGAHQGMWQYLWSTWASTPYAAHSPYSPKWSSLATGWMWAHGRRGEWAC